MASNETRELILDTMQDLIQSRGFSAVSYQDISDRLGIRKASIHYHFPSKFDLGKAVIERYRWRLAELMAKAAGESGWSHWEVLSSYFIPWVQVANSSEKVCLCGALAGEFMSLPDPMREEVSAFFRHHEEWLETLLEKAREAGEFNFSGPAKPMARMVLSSLQGGLLLKRSEKNPDLLTDIIGVIKSMLQLRA